MSNEFKKRFMDYIDGNLSDEENEKVKMEIEMLDQYQEVLDEVLGEDKKKIYKGEKKIIKVSKRKAKLENVKTVLGILALIVLIVMIIDIFTSSYYNAKDPARIESYRTAISVAVATTQPNITVGGSSSSTGTFFTSEIDSRLKKVIGSERIEIGEFKTKFKFSKAEVEWSKLLDNHLQEGLFLHPDNCTKIEALSDDLILEKLPEGTVAEAFVSLDSLYEVDEILEKLKYKDLQPIWYVVDDGCEKVEFDGLIGFPHQTLWNDSYWTLESHTEEEVKGKLNITETTETSYSPSIEEYGSGEIRSENFMKNLKFLQEHSQIVNQLTAFGEEELINKIDYLETNGVRVYGLVLTGPSKEILKLEDEAWVTNIKIGEVRFWNWKQNINKD